MSKHSGMQQHMLIKSKNEFEEILELLRILTWNLFQRHVFYCSWLTADQSMPVPFLPLQLGGKSVQISWWLLLPHTAEDENSEDPGQCEYRTEEGRWRKAHVGRHRKRGLQRRRIMRVKTGELMHSQRYNSWKRKCTKFGMCVCVCIRMFIYMLVQLCIHAQLYVKAKEEPVVPQV